MRKNKTVKAKAEDLFIRLTVIQVVAAMLLGGIFFGAYKLNSNFFDGLHEGFLQLMSVDRDIGNYLPYNIMREPTTEEEITDSANPEKKAKEASAKEAKPEPEAEPTKASPKGAGGEDSSMAELSEASSENEVAVLSLLPTAVMPVEGVVSSSFGNRLHPVYGTEGFHSGLDIAADEGSEVLAVFEGTVTEIGVGEKSGKYIKLDNGKGVETLYCHCSKIVAEKGSRVKKGEKIALVGQTGLATGPHLHLELHINGEKCDPACLFPNIISVS